MIKKILYFLKTNHQLRWFHFFLIFTIAFAIVVIRRPDLLIYPQFWAEDGTMWYQGAYTLGWQALLFPKVGYLQTIPRLTAAFAQLLPLAFAPLFFNLMAIFIKILPVVFIFSVRFDKIFKNIGARLLLAVVYLALPNTSDIYANITNSQWHLAILSFLLIIADRPKSRLGIVVDSLAMIVAALSGPFSVFLLPILLWRRFREPKEWPRYAPLTIGGLIQGLFLIAGAMTKRSAMSLGATPGLFVKIVSGQIYLGSLIGHQGYAQYYNSFFYTNSAFSKMIYLIIFLFCSGIVAYAVWKGPLELRLFVVFALILLFFSLIKPMASAELPQWMVMARPGAAGRYWFLPMLAFLFSSVWLIGQKPLLAKMAGAAVLLAFAYGLQFEFFYKPWPDRGFKAAAVDFEKAQTGEIVTIPQMPIWWHSLQLIKK